MLVRTLSLATMIVVIGSGSAEAQQAPQQEQMLREQVVALEAQSEMLAKSKQRSAENEMKLREAEARLQAAAKEVAALSRGLASRSFSTMTSQTITQSGPRLGVALATKMINGEPDGKGVQVMSVSPGSPAAEAGVLAGDRLVSVANLKVDVSNAKSASDEIGKLLEGKEVGDTIALTILRNEKEKTLSVVLNEQAFSAPANRFSMSFGGPTSREMNRFDRDVTIMQHDLSDADLGEASHRLFPGGPSEFHFLRVGSAWSSMQLVELSPGLGDYFGAEQGLLVVAAPSEGELGFEDGDVILKIGERQPKDVDHAMRILRSYAGGETLKVQILRKKRKRTLDITVPETVGDADGAFFEWQGDDATELLFIEAIPPIAPVAPSEPL